MKKSFHKLLSITLAAAVTAGSFSAYAVSASLDFSAETSSDKSYEKTRAEDTSSLLSAGILDYYAEMLPESSGDNLPQNESKSFLSSAVGFEGNGTESSPYLIKTSDELEYMSEAVEFLGDEYGSAYFKLANDIDMQGKKLYPIGVGKISADKVPSSAFSGVFDGDGHTISNFTLAEADDYVGLFGLVYNAEIKNLTLDKVKSEIMPTSAENATIYVGAIAARVVGIDDGNTSAIKNCRVTNSEFSIKTKFRIYGSAAIGYVIAENGGKVSVTDCSVENSICSFYVNDTVSTPTVNASTRSMIRAGGVIGYMSVVNADAEISGLSSDTLVWAEHSDVDANEKNDSHVGGAIGSVVVTSEDPKSYKSNVSIKNSYSSDMIFAKSEGAVFAGGFLGYAVSTQSSVSVSNCHTSVNVYTQSPFKYSYSGGFSSIFGIQSDKTNGTVGTLRIDSSYASGNTVDIRSKESIGGRFTSYVEGDKSASVYPEFKSCYSFADSVLYSGEYINQPPETEILSSNTAVLTSFDGFDDDVWKISDKLEIPVLINNEFSGAQYSAYFYSDSDNVLTEYAENVKYGETPDKPTAEPESFYVFSHWSLAPGKTDAFDANHPIIGSTVYFANNSDKYKSFKISFFADGKVFHTQEFEYNSAVSFPTAPAIPSDSFLKYAFSHWSKTKDGTAIDENKELVKGETTYYAVYKTIESSVWDGVSTNAFVYGDGTKDNPYQISDGYQLAYLAELVNSGKAESGAYYVMTGDADLGGCEWSPIGTLENPFDGHFLGDGYAVNDFKITNNDNCALGLFGSIKNAEISQVELSDFSAEISSESEIFIGALVGYSQNSKISQSTASGSVSLTSSSAYAGGIVGSADSSEISDCGSTVSVTASCTDKCTVGGVAGNLISSSVSAVFSGADVSASSDAAAYAGGIIGTVSGGTISHSFYSGSKVTASKSGESYGGLIYARAASGTSADISGCAVLKSASVSASTNNKVSDALIVDRIEKFYDASYLKSFIGFDFESIWAKRDNAFPTLSAFTRSKNVFTVKKFELSENGTLSLLLDISYRNPKNAAVLLSAYNVRGKMIAFEIRSIKDTSELNTISMELTDVADASECKFAVINPKTLAIIEDVVTID